MKIYKWSLNIGFAGCKHEGTVTFEDDATEEEIEEAIRDEVFGYVDWGYCLVEDVEGEE